MREDFHNFTSLDQFDQAKVNHFARLDAIPGFCLLRSEKEYLECYREILKKQDGLSSGGTQDPIYSKNEPAVDETVGEVEAPAEELARVSEPKKTRKTAKTVVTEE